MTKRPGRIIGVLLLLALLVVPRVIALDADTWPDLATRRDSGIWTDEGFYTYNARNAVLFGKAELDEFNNRNLSPVLDAVQRRVFARFGVGLVPARAISVVCALLALAFFYDALRRVWGWRVAVTSVILLGGEVAFILYSRLALMEPPSVLLLCVAFWALTRNRAPGWAVGGALAAGAIAFKTTFLLFLPLPILVWAWRWRVEKDEAAAHPLFFYTAGALLGAIVYLHFWGLPREAEIWRMNNYYRTRQVQPRSPGEVATLAHRALLGYREGLLQRLETRTPVLTTLALTGLLALPWRRRRGKPSLRSARTARMDMHRLLWLWTAAGFLMLSLSRYAPTRYYLVVYPALAGLAALTLWRAGPLWRWARARRRAGWAVPVLCAPAFFLFYHLLLPGFRALTVVHFGTASLIAGALLAGGWMYGIVLPRRLPHPRALAFLTLALFLVISYGQWGAWYATRGYRTRDVARELARRIPPGEVLAGDWAPNLCLDNRVRAVPVLPGLANWQDPVDRIGADWVLVTQTPYPVRFWRRQAAPVVRPENLVGTITVHDYRLHLYRVPQALRARRGRAGHAGEESA